MKLQLFDLAKDVCETKDVAADRRAVVMRIERIMCEQHVPSTLFPFKAIDGE